MPGALFWELRSSGDAPRCPGDAIDGDALRHGRTRSSPVLSSTGHHTAVTARRAGAKILAAPIHM